MIELPFIAYALISVLTLASIHLFSSVTKNWDVLQHGRLLSTGGGVAIAYVFIDLLPKLSKSDQIVTLAFEDSFPYFERHVYILALAGFLVFYLVDRSQSVLQKRTSYYLSLASYALFNFLIGYALVDENNPEVRPLGFFTFAMALHFFVNDYNLEREEGDIQKGKWILVFALLLGFICGGVVTLSSPAIALVSAFIGGGVIMNVTRHELPQENPNSTPSFIISCFLYTVILLTIG